MEDLEFKGNDPGAVRFGNFINYYQFHPPETRTSNLPKELWNLPEGNNDTLAVLDIGCNSGNLTKSLHQFLQTNSNCSKIVTLGIDIDPMLILRANEMVEDGLSFLCLNVVSQETRNKLDAHLKQFNKEKFDVLFCFSTTMWIHLNYGDDGMNNFLNYITEKSNMIVLEPQPWKCYRNAVRRMKKTDQVFPLYDSIKIRNNIESEIEKFILNTSNFVKIHEDVSQNWERKLLFFRNKNSICL